MANIFESLLAGIGKTGMSSFKGLGKSVLEFGKNFSKDLEADKSLIANMRAEAESIQDPVLRAKKFGELPKRGFRVNAVGYKSVHWAGSKVSNAFKSISGSKFGTGASMIASPLVKASPFVVGAGAAAFGAGRVMLERADQRTMQRSGMAGNNLGTDGLTLALSARRHR